MSYSVLPVFLRLDKRLHLVVGGGKVGVRRAVRLIDAGVAVEMITPVLDATFETIAPEKLSLLHLRKEKYSSRDLSDFRLVFACTNDPAVNQQVADDARRAGVPVNIADDPDGSDFFVPASFSRGSINIAVGTGGESPALAGRICRELADMYPEWYTAYSLALGRVRGWLRERETSAARRAVVLRKLVELKVADEVAGLNEDEMVAALRELAKKVLMELISGDN